jgi:fructokinase
VNDASYTVIGLGELLWDCFPEGALLGGAPANVAYHASALGDRGVVASRLGQDGPGDEALQLLTRRGVDTHAIQRDPDRSTGTAHITMDPAGEPSFAIDSSAAWTAPEWTPEWEALIAGADVICFGTLLCTREQGRTVVERAAATAPDHALLLLDLNLRPPFDTDGGMDAALACANTLKLSEHELARLGQRRGLEPAGAAEALLEDEGLRAVAVTRGAQGSLLYTAEGLCEHPGVPLPADVSPYADPVGAGDAFTAALAHHLVRGHTPARSSAAANRYAAFVASRPGATPRAPDAVVHAVRGEAD